MSRRKNNSTSCEIACKARDGPSKTNKNRIDGSRGRYRRWARMKNKKNIFFFLWTQPIVLSVGLRGRWCSMRSPEYDSWDEYIFGCAHSTRFETSISITAWDTRGRGWLMIHCVIATCAVRLLNRLKWSNNEQPKSMNRLFFLGRLHLNSEMFLHLSRSCLTMMMMICARTANFRDRERLWRQERKREKKVENRIQKYHQWVISCVYRMQERTQPVYYTYSLCRVANARKKIGWEISSESLIKIIMEYGWRWGLHTNLDI